MHTQIFTLKDKLVQNNYSESNLPKQERFRFRDLKEKEISELPWPMNYNLSDLNSIKKKVDVDVIRKINEKRISKLANSYSRFNDSWFYHEKERLMKGNDSVSPVKYDPLTAYKLMRSKKSEIVSFTKENRKLDLK